jgi:tRNA pseudouridine synthase 9
LPNPRATETGAEANHSRPQRLRLPREEGTDIGISSPVPLSDEAVRVIAKLRNMKDQDEDYSRWRDVIFRAKKAETLNPSILAKRGEDLDARASLRARELEEEERSHQDDQDVVANHAISADVSDAGDAGPVLTNMSSLALPTFAERIEPASSAPPASSSTLVTVDPGDAHYCPECYLPLQPDPKPERLFIFLHAWRYTTKEWSFCTEMPFWAAKGYLWDHEGNQPASASDMIALSSAIKRCA